MDLARKLIINSDVLIESFAPGAITRMGLGYEDVRTLNPGLIMISTCLMGQTGPAANLAGYGYHAGAMAGFYEVTGWPDLAPSAPWMAYTDTIAPRFISILLAAALDHRRRTGEGCYIDVAQIETARISWRRNCLTCKSMAMPPREWVIDIASARRRVSIHVPEMTSGARLASIPITNGIHFVMRLVSGTGSVIPRTPHIRNAMSNTTSLMKPSAAGPANETNLNLWQYYSPPVFRQVQYRTAAICWQMRNISTASFTGTWIIQKWATFLMQGINTGYRAMTTDRAGRRPVSVNTALKSPLRGDGFN